jgi:cobalamin synthase
VPWALDGGQLVGWFDGWGTTTYQSPLENSFALRLAERGERGVAETAALKARIVARREVACMVAGVEGDVLGVQVWIGELMVWVWFE